MRMCLRLRIAMVFFHTEEGLYARDVGVFLTVTGTSFIFISIPIQSDLKNFILEKKVYVKLK